MLSSKNNHPIQQGYITTYIMFYRIFHKELILNIYRTYPKTTYSPHDIKKLKIKDTPSQCAYTAPSDSPTTRIIVQIQLRFYDIIQLWPISYQYRSNFTILKLKQFCNLPRKLCFNCYHVYLNVWLWMGSHTNSDICKILAFHVLKNFK